MKSRKKGGRIESDTAPAVFLDSARSYAISITFFGNGRCDCALVLSQTFARHRPTNGATTIDPNATANAACMRVSSFARGLCDIPGSLAQIEILSSLGSCLAPSNYRLWQRKHESHRASTLYDIWGMARFAADGSGECWGRDFA